MDPRAVTGKGIRRGAAATGVAVLAAAGVAILALAPGAPGSLPAPRSLSAAGGPGEGSPDGRANAVWVERERYLMGTLLRIRLEAPDRREGFRAAEAAFRAVERAEEQLSTWRADTELSRLNRAPPGRAVSLSPVLVELLATLHGWTERTGGAFDPTVGSLVEVWGLREEGTRPSASALRTARQGAGWRHFELDRSRNVARRLHPAAWIDAGAFGKGLALRRARESLVAEGVESALLDFGGQVVTLGTPPGEADCWPLAVADPRRRHEPVAELPLCVDGGEPAVNPGASAASAATTSAGERFVTADGERLGHVLDPRSGRPVPPWGSVTVIRRDPMEADVLATALFVMGPESAREWARKHGVAALFLVTEDEEGLRRHLTPALEARLGSAPRITLHGVPGLPGSDR